MIVLNQNFSASRRQGGVAVLFFFGDALVVSMSDYLKVKKPNNN